MFKSKFKFFAYTNPGFESILRSEIGKSVKKAKVTNIFGNTGVEFRADLKEMVDVIKTSQTLSLLCI